MTAWLFAAGFDIVVDFATSANEISQFNASGATVVVCAVSWIMTRQVLAAFCAALAVALVSLPSVQAQNEINSKLNSGASRDFLMYSSMSAHACMTIIVSMHE